MSVDPTALGRWVDALAERHLSTLTFQEVRRALQALSRLYLSGRGRRGVALDGAGKRAALALFYAPIHFLIVDRIVDRLGAAGPELQQIVDLGCGTAPASAAWALACVGRPEIRAFDLDARALDEARQTLAAWDLTGRTRRADIDKVRLGSARSAIVAAYSVNELRAASRDRLLERLLAAHGRGAKMLVVEPIAKRRLGWWPTWSDAVRRAGGRADEWEIELELPDLLQRLDAAAGMRHSIVKARSLSL